MAATRASGTNAVRYGTMRDAVLGLEAVLADGSIISDRGQGAEIVRRLRPHPSPDRLRRHARRHHLAHPQALRHPRDDPLRRSARSPRSKAPATPPSPRCRWGSRLPASSLLDEVQIRACNAYSHLGLPETPTLFLEFHGTPLGDARAGRGLRRASRAPKGEGSSQWAERPEDRSKLWQARHDAYWAARGLRPGAEVLSTDVCVPISALAACVGRDPRTTSTGSGCSPRSSAMSATAISMSCR